MKAKAQLLIMQADTQRGQPSKEAIVLPTKDFKEAVVSLSVMPANDCPNTSGFENLKGNAIVVVGVILYSNQTRSMIQTDEQFPSVRSQDRDLLINSDGSAGKARYEKDAGIPSEDKKG